MSEANEAGFGRAALEQLYVQMERPLYNVVFRYIWSREESSEIVQETFVRLWAARARVRPETARALAYQIGLNLARKRRRWLSIRSFFSLGHERSEQPLQDEILSDHERALSLRSALAALPDAQRDVILLCHFSELSYREVAEILGIPEGTVGSRRTNALRALSATLGGEHGR